MFKIATFNILHGYHKDKILKSIQTLIEKGADVICLQEVEIPLEEILPSGWQVEYFHGEDRGCNLAILWDKSKLNFIKKEKILLPIPSKKVFIWRFTSYYYVKIQRGALAINFSVNGKVLRVTNVHLACEGDIDFRVKQLKHIFISQKEDKTDFDIFAGDFNTAVPLMFKKYQEKRLEQAFGKEYINIFPKLKYTCGFVSEFDPTDGMARVKKILNFLGIRLKSRLDYMFSRNLKVVSKEMLDLPGSDHRPLLAELEIL